MNIITIVIVPNNNLHPQQNIFGYYLMMFIAEYVSLPILHTCNFQPMWISFHSISLHIFTYIYAFDTVFYAFF